MAHDIHLELSISGGVVRLALLLGALLTVPLELGSETISLSTTYPSPVGIYNRLITTGGTGGTANSTQLARDRSDVFLVPNSNPGGHTYIGTTLSPALAGIPSERLVVGEPTAIANISQYGYLNFRQNSNCIQTPSTGAGVDTCPSATQYATFVPGIFQNGIWLQSNPESDDAISFSGGLLGPNPNYRFYCCSK